MKGEKEKGRGKESQRHNASALGRRNCPVVNLRIRYDAAMHLNHSIMLQRHEASWPLGQSGRPA